MTEQKLKNKRGGDGMILERHSSFLDKTIQLWYVNGLALESQDITTGSDIDIDTMNTTYITNTLALLLQATDMMKKTKVMNIIEWERKRNKLLRNQKY